jgi:putative methyltransferase (TIGR04325 family)
MMGLKNVVRALTPPILLAPFRKPSHPTPKSPQLYHGSYSKWGDAVREADGYDAEIILSTQRQATAKVRDGLAVYERDSVIFPEIEYSFPVLAALLNVASLRGNRLHVLDFGGALGSSYFQNRAMLSHMEALSWCIVEQPQFVAIGKAEFESETLHFFETIEGAVNFAKPDVILMSSVLQYLEFPFALLSELDRYKIDFLLLDRTPVMDRAEERIVVQTVPPSIYPSSYACRLFGKGEIEAALEESYTLKYAFQAHIGSEIILADHERATWRGFFFERRDAHRS